MKFRKSLQDIGQTLAPGNNTVYRFMDSGIN